MNHVPRSFGIPVRPSRAGFALLITILLLSMMVLLVVSMAALTRVETQVAANYQQIDLARQNALMGLKIAIGQLQASAGLDQRITTRADILDSTPATAAITGVNQPYWTGVWKTGSASPDVTLSGTAQRQTTFGSLTPTLAQKSSSATWLVSRPNASSVVDPLTNTFTIAETLTGVDLTAAGQSGVTTAASSSTPTAVMLAKNLGRKDSSIAYNAANNVGYVVAAPLVDLSAPVAALGNASKPIGRYAYWVSDEGIKARVNIKDPTLKTSSTGATQVDAVTNLATNQLHFVAPQSTAAHKILPSTLATDFRGAADYRQNPKVDQVLTPQQLPLLPAVAPTGYVSNIYLPDITTYSYGVLADVRNGGLRKDLTAALEDTGGTANKNFAKLNPYSSAGQYISRVFNIFTDTIPQATQLTTTFNSVGSINNHASGLLWNDLHRFYNSYKSTQPTLQLANLPAPAATAARPSGVGSPAASRPYVVSATAFTSYETNNAAGTHSAAATSTMVTGTLSPICIGLRYDCAIKSVESPVGSGNYKLFIEYHPVSTWYNPYGVTIHSTVSDEAVVIQPERPYLTVETTTGGVTTKRYCILPQMGTPGLMNDPLHTANFEPGAIRVFARSANYSIPATSTVPFGKIGNSLRDACNFNMWSTPAPALVSKNATFNFCNQAEFISVANTSDLTSSTVPYTPISSLPGATSVKLSLTTQGSSSYNSQIPARLEHWSGGTGWPNLGQWSSLTSSYGFSPGKESLGVATSWGAPPTYSCQLSQLTAPMLLCTYNFRVKGLISTPSPSYSNSSFQVPLFMGNSDGFNPIRGNSSSYWNEFRVLNLSSWPPAYSNPSDIMIGADTGTYTYTTWGDQSTGAMPAAQGGSYRKILADIPLQPMVSLGQFMHLQAYNCVMYDSYAHLDFGSMFVGGSYANPVVPLSQTLNDNIDNSHSMGGFGNAFYSLDYSYLANQALFDGFYFSTVPPAILPAASTIQTINAPNAAQFAPTGQVNPTQWTAFNAANPNAQLVDASTPFLNSRMVPYRKNGVVPALANLRDMDKAAANLLLLGAFNINSTSVDAWRALLSSLSGNDLSMWSASDRLLYTFTAAELKNPIPRFWSSTGNANINTPWCGVRALSDTEVMELATRIVAEVKTRGPFLSMADFLNRRLGASSTDLTRAGALQAAIDKTSPDINSAIKISGVAVDVAAAVSGSNNLPGGLPILANMQDASSTSGQTWNTTVGMPGYLMQQDLVQAFSPVMAARSDTFVVRAYGEKTDPLTLKPVAKAYCEAVVQRLPDYVDPNDPALITTQTGYAGPAGDATPPYKADGVTPIVNITNQNFGRHFKIVSFRWITPNDL